MKKSTFNRCHDFEISNYVCKVTFNGQERIQGIGDGWECHGEKISTQFDQEFFHQGSYFLLCLAR